MPARSWVRAAGEAPPEARSLGRDTRLPTDGSTSMRAPMTMSTHEVSKWGVMVRRWSGDTIGPTIIAAPQRGHTQVARTGVSVVDVVSESALAVGGVASTVWARARRAARHVFARNPDWRMRTKPRGRMCWTKRRRNSLAVSVIVRRWSPWA